MNTECVSAVTHNRHFWAAEIKPEYVELSNSRIAEAKLELSQTLSMDKIWRLLGRDDAELFENYKYWLGEEKQEAKPE